MLGGDETQAAEAQFSQPKLFNNYCASYTGFVYLL